MRRMLVAGLLLLVLCGCGPTAQEAAPPRTGTSAAVPTAPPSPAEQSAAPSSAATHTSRAEASAEPSGGAGPAAAEAPGCPDVRLLGARGSGEREGLGSRVGAIAAAFTEAVDPGLEVVVEPVPYGAPPVDWALNRSADYVAASQDGAAALLDRLLASAQACPATRLVLAGYSSGAMVVHLALVDPAAAPVLPLVAAVELLSDPLRPADDATAGSTAGPYAGIAQLYRDVEPGPVPAVVAAVTSSRCLRGDAVCAYAPEVDLMEAIRVHTTGYQVPAVAGAAGAVAAARVRPS